MEDHNAKLCCNIYEDTVGLDKRNEIGEKLIKLANVHGIVHGNTWFKKQPRRLWTWKNPRENQMHYISQYWIQKYITGGKTLPG